MLRPMALSANNMIEDLPPPLYRVKVMEPVKNSSREYRLKLLEEKKFNMFAIPAEDVIVDYLTDSGTGALSSKQAAVMQLGDESYAGSESFYRFEKAVKFLFPFKHVLPTHQGRAAERILFQALGGAGKVFPNNTHFDTTRGNIEATGAKAVDLPCIQSKDTQTMYPFKGNMDVQALKTLLDLDADKVPVVLATATNNSCGGQPISMENLREIRKICNDHKKWLFMDACRFAENAWFIRERESGYKTKAVVEIVHEMAALLDGMIMSAKKDGLSHIGGWLAMNDDKLHDECLQNLIMTEGFRTYGGLAGRDLEIIAQGLSEVVQQEYLDQRIDIVRYLGEQLDAAGVPVLNPIGGHAVYIDAAKLLPHIAPLQFPGHALAVELYLEGGIRSHEIGSLVFGKIENGVEVPAPQELLRLAVPRRTYTKEHMNYTVAVFQRLMRRCKDLQGFEIIKQPKALRHFTAELRPMSNVRTHRRPGED